MAKGEEGMSCSELSHLHSHQGRRSVKLTTQFHLLTSGAVLLFPLDAYWPGYWSTRRLVNGLCSRTQVSVCRGSPSCSYVIPHTHRLVTCTFWVNDFKQHYDDRNIARRGAISFALLLFGLHTHNQRQCPLCSSSTDTLLTADARCLCTATV